MKKSMKKKESQVYPFKVNPYDPREWTLICKVVVALTLLLIIDWILGLSFGIPALRYSYLSDKMAFDNGFLITIFPLMTLLIVLLISPLLNNKLSTTPVYGAIIILIIIYLGGVQFTILGTISKSLLNFTCSVVIVLVSLNITILENDEPVDPFYLILIGFILLLTNFFIDLFIYGWRINETWALIYLLVIAGGMMIIQKNRLLIGALPIFICAILNDYIFARVLEIGLIGFDAGAILLRIISILQVIHHFIRK